MTTYLQAYLHLSIYNQVHSLFFVVTRPLAVGNSDWRSLCCPFEDFTSILALRTNGMDRNIFYTCYLDENLFLPTQIVEL